MITKEWLIENKIIINNRLSPWAFRTTKYDNIREYFFYHTDSIGGKELTIRQRVYCI